VVKLLDQFLAKFKKELPPLPLEESTEEEK